MKYLALCCIAKDEDRFLKEWIACHAAIGFEHFIIYDNNSARPIAELLDGFAGPENVTVVRNTVEQTQYVAYNHCLGTFGADFKWIAFLDVDEVIQLAEGDDARLFLAEYEPYASLGLHWRMFSSSGHDRRPEGLVIENYTAYLCDDIHIKSIVQPARVVECTSPHAFRLAPGDRGVNVDHFPIPGGFSFTVPGSNKACVNHYYYRSRECFEEKIAKGNPCNLLRRMSEFDGHLGLPVKKDTGMLRRVGKVRRSLVLDRLMMPDAPQIVAATPAVLGGTGGTAPASLDPVTAAPAGTAAAQALLSAARVHIEQGDYQQAEVCLCHAMLHPEELVCVDVWNLRALAARKQKRFPHAEYCLKQALSMTSSVQSYLELANLLLDTGQIEESKKAVSIVRAYEKLSKPVES